MENKMKENKNKQGEYIFLGCTLIGMGIGVFLDNLLVFMFIGIGVGYLGKALLASKS